MTVCGEKVTGVCAMGKCPHFKRCCPTVWDKYGKIEPKTNEEWLRQANKEEMEHTLTMLIMKDRFFADKEFAYVNIRFGVHCWLKEKHEENECKRDVLANTKTQKTDDRAGIHTDLQYGTVGRFYEQNGRL